MAKFDMELLSVFEAIYTSGSITRAAECLGIAQPTVSIALAKLRAHFGDPLFTRTSRGMEPTPHAQSIVADVRTALGALHNALRYQKAFDPASSDREFKIGMTDISEIVLLPTLLNHLKRIAPGVRIDAITISPDTPAQLEAGEVDLAVGFLPHLEAGFYQQKLFDQNFVCLVADDHQRIGATTTRNCGKDDARKRHGATHRPAGTKLSRCGTHRRTDRLHRNGAGTFRQRNDTAGKDTYHRAPTAVT